MEDINAKMGSMVRRATRAPGTIVQLGKKNFDKEADRIIQSYICDTYTTCAIRPGFPTSAPYLY